MRPVRDISITYLDSIPILENVRSDTFVRELVDLVIEFQTNYQSASLGASMILEAVIPMIAIDIPHPGATYYGADNY